MPPTSASKGQSPHKCFARRHGLGQYWSVGVGSGSLRPLGDGTSVDGAGASAFHPWALGAWEGAEAETLNAAIDLSEAEYERYEAAVQPILALSDRLAFRMVERNFRQLNSLHEFYGNLFSQAKEKGRIDARDAGFNLMVAVMNWLTAARLFLDHQVTHYARRHGKESTQLARFKDACSVAFDNSFGYRFTSKLRNYAQHCGLPLGGVELLPPLEGQSGHQRVSFYLDRDLLLTNYEDWGRIVRPELAQLPPKFEVLPLVEEAMERLRSLARESLRIDVEVAQEGVVVVREALERVRASGVQGGFPSLFRFTARPAGKVDFSFTRLPAESLDVLDAMAAHSGDPLDLLPAKGPVEAPTVRAEQRYRDRRGIAVLSAWLREGGGTQQFFETVNELVSEDGDIEPVLTGVINVSTVLLTMAAAAVGTSEESILGDLAESASEDTVEGELSCDQSSLRSTT